MSQSVSPALREDGDLCSALRSRRLSETHFAADIPDGWGQGRGVFGGMVMGTLAQAMVEFVGDGERPLRALSAELPGPTQAGAAELQLELLRRSGAVTTVVARLVQAGEVQAFATGVFGKTRITDRNWVEQPPQPPPAESVAIVPPTSRQLPQFTSKFEYRSMTPGAVAGASDSLAAGWVRPLAASRGIGPVELVALIDTWWPAALARETTFRPMATLAFAVHLLAPAQPLPSERPLFYQARALGGRDGFVSELRELWDEHGQLLAVNHQTFVYIK